MWANSPRNTAGGRSALASASATPRARSDDTDARPVALHRYPDLAQRRRAGELRVKQRCQLRLGRQLAHASIRPALVHKFVEHRPGYVLQKSVQDAIVMTYGAVSFSCPNHCQVFENVESTPWTLYTATERDSRAPRKGRWCGRHPGSRLMTSTL
jgi:hypothetical protein